jgi:hypothetical protein
MNTKDSDDDLRCCRRNFDGGDGDTTDSASGEVSYAPWLQAYISCLEE